MGFPPFMMIFILLYHISEKNAMVRLTKVRLLVQIAIFMTKNTVPSKNDLQFYEKYGKIIEFEHVYECVTECTERKKIT